MQASTYPMVSIEEAIEAILTRTSVLPSENLDLTDALGRVLAESVTAIDDMPPFKASAVDGYAVVVADSAAPRRVLDEVIAGNASVVTVAPGSSVRIMTGAPVPPGADAVIMVEQVTEDNGVMSLSTAPRVGDNIYPRGQDVTRGQVVLTAGSPLNAPEIGLLATVGRTRVQVYRRPTVAIMSTGDELIDAGEPLRSGAIRDSNGPALMASIVEAGGRALFLGRVRDDEAEQEALIRHGLSVADMVLTSGGVSVGSRDLIKPILRRIGTIHFGRVAFKPGKPTTFATIGNTPVFGLPGFPVSSLVSFETFVRPAIRKMQGFRTVLRPTVRVVVEHEVHPTPDRTEYQRAIVRWSNGRFTAEATGIQRSSRLLSLVGANAFLRIEPGTTKLPAGSEIVAMLIGEVVSGPAS